MRSLNTAMKSSPLSLQLEKSLVQQRRLRAAKIREKKKKEDPFIPPTLTQILISVSCCDTKVIFRSVLPGLEKQTNKELCDNVTSVIKRCVNVLCG